MVENRSNLLMKPVSTLPLIYFVRHGQTDWNVEGRLQGQAETDINATGRLQVEKNAATLRRLIVDPSAFNFVASPSRRTCQTMERLLIGMGLDPASYRVDARLMEINFGDWQGFTYEELEEHQPGATLPRSAGKWLFRPPGTDAENYEMLKERVAYWLSEVSQPTICVTHGGVLRTVFHMVAGMPRKKAAGLVVPQDRILRLEGGRLEWFS